MQLELSNINLGYDLDSNNPTNLIQNLSFTIDQKEKMVILGENGSGKTTLLNYIESTFSQKFKISFVRQFNENINNVELNIVDYLTSLCEDWWILETKLIEVFGYIIQDYNQLVVTLSGGELVKIHLAAALLKNPEILLLDEPTNHLDFDSIKRLVEALKTFGGILIFVSHNHTFIQSVGTSFLELAKPNFLLVKGKFEDFQEHKLAILNSRLKQNEITRKNLKNDSKNIELQVDRSKKGYQNKRKKFLDGSIDAIQWAGSKPGLKVGAAKIISQANQKITDSRLTLAQNQIHSKTRINFELSNTKMQIGRSLFDLQDIDLIIENIKLIEKINWRVEIGQRIGLFGNNGSGKSALVKSVLNSNLDSFLIQAPQNSRLNISTFTSAYIDQHYSLLNLNQTVLENLAEQERDIAKVRAWLANFRFFTTEQVNQLTYNLSGGQKARLALAKATINGCELLVLDEPNNNLDLASQDELITCLSNYQGAIICISHDLEFLHKIEISGCKLISNKKLDDYVE